MGIGGLVIGLVLGAILVTILCIYRYSGSGPKQQPADQVLHGLESDNN